MLAIDAAELGGGHLPVGDRLGEDVGDLRRVAGLQAVGVHRRRDEVDGLAGRAEGARRELRAVAQDVDRVLGRDAGADEVVEARVRSSVLLPVSFDRSRIESPTPLSSPSVRWATVLIVRSWSSKLTAPPIAPVKSAPPARAELAVVAAEREVQVADRRHVSSPTRRSRAGPRS
jgi:hypothetical protein